MAVATTLSGSVSIKVTGTLTRTETEGSDTVATATTTPSLTYTLSLGSGTDIDQIDKVFKKRYALSTTPTSLDLSGSLTDPMGNTVVFAEVVAIIIVNLSTTVGQVVNVGGNAAPFSAWLGAANDVLKIGPGGAHFLSNPAAAAYTVTNTTADILDLTAAAGTPSVDVMIFGRSA